LGKARLYVEAFTLTVILVFLTLGQASALLFWLYHPIYRFFFREQLQLRHGHSHETYLREFFHA
jgi:hypothetical protein